MQDINVVKEQYVIAVWHAIQSLPNINRWYVYTSKWYYMYDIKREWHIAKNNSVLSHNNIHIKTNQVTMLL